MASKHVSNQLKEQAAAAIDAKLALLMHWLKIGIPWKAASDGMFIRDKNENQILEFFPDDIRAFANWTAADNSENLQRDHPSLATFRRFSRGTLNQPHNVVRLTSLREVLRAISEKSRLQYAEVNLSGRVSLLEKQCNSLRSLVRVQERDIFLLRERVKIAEQTAAVANEEKRLTLENAALEIKRVKNQNLSHRSIKATVTRLKPLEK
jgi:hypothetical protein